MKYYTIQEANDMIPRLTALLREMQSRGPQLAQIGAKQVAIKRKIATNGHHAESDDATLKREERPVEQAIRSSLGLLAEWNIQLKDLQRGLIDFPAMRDGEMVYLCWELGESEVGYWHNINTGYSDRQPLDDRIG